MGIFSWDLKSRPNWPRPWAVYYLSLASTLWDSDGPRMDLSRGLGPPVQIKKKKFIYIIFVVRRLPKT